MANISPKPGPADRAKTKAQLLAELNELRRRVAQWEAAADPLNHSEERYRSVVAAMAEGLVMQQRSGEIVACNPAAEQILGLTREQMMGRTSLDLRWRAIHEDGTPFPGKTHPAMITLRTGQPQRNVIMGVHKPDGCLTWILINSEPMVQPGASEPYAVVTTFTDITQQRRAEAALRENQERLALTIQGAELGTWDWRVPNGAVVFNERWAEMLGYSLAEIEPHVSEWEKLLHPDDAAFVMAAVKAHLEGHTPLYQTEHRLRSKSGEWKWVLDTGQVFERDEQGQPARVVGIHQDITERKQAEAQLRESERFAQATIDALPEHLCVLNEKGVIIAVNQAWREFAEANPPVPANYSLGINYLAVCDRVSGPEQAEADTFAAGIRAVLRGEVGQFSLEYPCPAPWEPRWFIGVVSRFPGEGPVRVVVSHQNITPIKRAEIALVESEQKFRQIVKQSNDAIILTDETGHLIEWNPAAKRILGLKPAEVLGWLLWDNLYRIAPPEQQTPERYEQLKTGWLTYFQTGQHPSLNQAVELEIQHPDGTRRMVQTARFSIKTERGYLLSAVIRDVTEHRQIEAKLRESEARFKAVFDCAGVGITLIDPNGPRLQGNPALQQMLGYSAEELSGAADMHITHPDDRALSKARLADLLTGRLDSIRLEKRYLHKNGQTVWADLSITPIRAGQGQPVAFIGAMVDITARKEAEAALRASEARFATVFRANPLSISIARMKDSQFIDVNEMWQTKTGISREEAIGRTALELNMWPNPADRERLIRQLRELGTVQSFEAQIRVKSGAVEDVLMSAEVVEVMGEPCLLILAQGITERKWMEAALRKSEALFKTIFQASPLSISIVREKDHQFVEVNQAWVTKSGFSREETIGRTALELKLWVNPDEREQFLTQLSKHGSVQGLEVQFRLKSGALVEVLIAAELIDIAEERCMLVITQNITERKQIEKALRESEQKLRQIIERSGDGVFLADETGRIVEWNPMMEQITSLSWAAVVGRMMGDVQFDLVPVERRTPAKYDRIVVGVRVCFQTDQNLRLNQPVEAEIQRPDGEYRDIQTVSFSVKTGAGFGVGSIVRDVTERKQVERIEAALLAVSQVLARSPEPAVALRQVLEAITVRLGWQLAHLWRLDSSGSRLVWQENWCAPDLPELVAFAQISRGYTFEPGDSLTGTVWQTGQAIWDQDLRLVKGASNALAAGLHSASGIPIIKDGETVGVMTFFSRSARPLNERLLTTLTDLGGQIGQFLARKEAEITLRRYERMVSTTPDWMSLIDRHYIHRIVNQAFLSLGTKTYDQIIGHTTAELLGEAAFSERVKPYLDQALAGETVQYQEWFDFSAAGRCFINVTYAPYQEKDGAISGALVSGRNMTEAKLLEEKLRQAQKMETVGQLAAGMAHHYNSMLTGIIGFTSLSLRTLPPGDPIAKNLERVLATAERMAVLVRQLLAFAQKQLLHLKTIPLNDLVIQLQDQLKQATPAPIEFTFSLAPDVGQVKVDPHQFEYLLLALVSNAADAMPRGGQLTLTTATVSLGPVEAGWYELTPGDYVLLTVKDTGIGLTDEVKAHLFEPFFTTKDVGQGTGLGLAMSLGIAKQHRGHLFAESEPGQGAAFMLYLPCLAQLQPPSPPVRSTPAPTILLIEAEPMVREFVAEILSDEGYSVLKATNAEVAQQRMAGRPEVSLHLLLTPAHSNSPALIEQLKANSPGLKVIFLIDELADLSFELKGTQASFLLKPFTPSSLVQKIKAVLEAVA